MPLVLRLKKNKTMNPTQHYCESCQEFYSAKHECKFECRNCKVRVNPQVKHECRKRPNIGKFGDKIVRFCSRCGKEWCVLGKVIEVGKHYPAFTIKTIDGDVEKIPADTEIKEAVCRDCAKELYDLDNNHKRPHTCQIEDKIIKRFPNMGELK